MPTRQRPFECGRLMKGCCLFQLATWTNPTTGFSFPLPLTRRFDTPDGNIHLQTLFRNGHRIVRNGYPFYSTRRLESRLPQDESISSERFSSSIRDRAQWSTSRLLHELDQRGIRYSPTSSRKDLEDLLLESLTNQVFRDEATNEILDTDTNHRTTASSPPLNEILDERLQRRARRRHQRYGSREATTTFSSPQLLSTWSRTVARHVPKVAGAILDRAERKARRLQRRAADFWALDDETGVRDARFQYLQQRKRPSYQRRSDPNVEVIVESDDSSNLFGDYESVFSRQPGNVESNTLHTKPTSSSYQHQSQRQRRSDIALDRKPVDGAIDSTNPFSHSSSTHHPLRLEKTRLLPASTSPQQNLPRTASNRPKRPRSLAKIASTDSTPSQPKKVYSPYTADSLGFFSDSDGLGNVDRDIVDKVSEFLADAADKVMWGKFDQGQDQVGSAADPNNRQKPDPAKRPPRVETHQSPRHWKDRLEESLDSVLGLSEDGAFYNRWSAQFNKEGMSNDSAQDAFSVARGDQVHKRQRRYDKPFWEEEGNIFALLLGRTRSGRDLFFDDRIALGSSGGSLLLVFRAALKSFLIVTSYLCRWASTQGALPQPIVVMGVGAAALCAPPRRRLTTVIIALLLLRTVGEVLHGYVKGTDGWDNETDETME